VTLPAGARGFVVLAGLAGCTGVIMAAAGSHLGGIADHPADWRAWQAASLMQLVHAAALLGVAALWERHASVWLTLAGWLMVAGMVLFSGSLYAHVLFAWSTRLAPVGGSCLILAWALLVPGALARRKAS